MRAGIDHTSPAAMRTGDSASRRISRRGTLRGRAAAAGAALAVGLAGCGSDTPTSADSAAEGTPSAASADAAGSEAAVAAVEQYRQPTTAKADTGPAFDATSFKGGSIHYVALSQAIPVLAREQNAIKQAADALGMSFNVCDGKFQPAQAAACINAAVSAGATGIVTDAIVIDAVSTAAANAKSKSIPIVAMSSIGTDTDDVVFRTNGDELSHEVAAQWIVADSGGTAQVLQTGVQDDSGAINDIENGSQPVFDKCPGCSVVRATYTAQTVPGIPSLISSSLLKNRDRDYGFPQFDFLVPLFKSGVQTAGFTDKMKIVSTNAVLSSMELVKNGGQAADAGSNRNYSGWAATDTLLRMAEGLPVQTYKVPVRLFDKNNVESVQLDEAAALTGEWFGPLTYQQDFQKLWGLG